MKIKSILTLLFVLAVFIQQASAYTVILSGGTAQHRFRYVKCTPTMLKCIGNGTNTCPASFDVTNSYKSAWYNAEKIIEFVFDQVNSGNKAGEVKYENDLPVSWSTGEDDTIEINIEEGGVRGIEPYETE